MCVGEQNVWSLIPNPHSDWKFPDGWTNALTSNSVMWVSVTLFDDTFMTGIGKGLARDSSGPKVPTSGEKVWPGGVPPTYPSGRGGPGGPSARLLCLGESRVSTGIPIGDLLDATVASGGNSPTISGRAPVYTTTSARPPAFVEIKVVRYVGPWPTSEPPKLNVVKCPFPIVAAADAAGRLGQQGTRATVSAGADALKVFADADPTRQALARQLSGAPHPLQVEPVLQFVRDAYLNGQRDEARKVLGIYRQALDRIPAADRSVEILSQLTEIKALLTQMDNNLDYYGNPPGWLPRLSLVSNLQLFFADQKNAVELLYYAYKLEKSWATVENQAQLLKGTATALRTSIQLAQSRFGEALRLLDSSRSELASIEGNAAESKRKFEALNNRINEKAKDIATEQAILSGICDLAAGVCQVIPVGQPFLGTAGSTVFKLAGNIDLSNPSAMGEAFTFAKGFGNSLKTYIDENQEKLSEASDDSFARKLKMLQGSLEATETEISTINDQVATKFDAKTKAHRDEIAGKIDALEKESKDITGDAKETAELKIRSFKEELALYKSRKLHEAVIALRKEQAAADKKGLTPAELEEKKKLLSELALLETEKKTLTSDSEKLKGAQENQAAFLKDAMTTASSIGAGIGSFASGLSKLVVPVSPDDPAVKAIRSKIADSKQFKTELAGLVQDMDDLSASKQKLMESIGRAQNQASECCATIAKSLVQAAAIGRQLQDVGASLNLDVKAFARDLRKRSGQRLQKSLYFVVKSYEYAYLKRVEEDIYGTALVEQIRGLEETKRKVAGLDPVLSVDDFAKIYEVVFRDKFATLGNKIIDDLQHLKPSMQNQYLCTLEADHLKTLNETWRFPFRIVETFQKTGGHGRDVVGARILGIVVKTLTVESTASGLSLDIEFTHSGEHLIGDPAGYEYYFRIGKYPVEAQDGSGEIRWVDDDPICWRMIYNAADADDKKVMLDSTSTEAMIAPQMLREFKEMGRTDLKLERASALVHLGNHAHHRRRPRPEQREGREAQAQEAVHGEEARVLRLLLPAMKVCGAATSASTMFKPPSNFAISRSTSSVRPPVKMTNCACIGGLRVAEYLWRKRMTT